MKKILATKQQQSFVLMLLVAAAWGAGFPVMKLLLAEFSPYSLLSTRFLLAGMLVALIFVKSIANLTLNELKKAIYLGLALSTSFIFLIVGLQYTLASKAGFITATSIIWVPVIECAVDRKKMGLTTTISIIICLIGLGFLTSIKTGKINTGDILILLGAIIFAIHIILIDKLSPLKNHSIISIQLLMTGISSGIAGALLKQLSIPSTLSYAAITELLFVTIIATAFTVWAQTKFQQHISPTTASFLFLLEPVFAMIFSILLLKEGINFSELIGASIILAGVIFYLLSTTQQSNNNR